MFKLFRKARINKGLVTLLLVFTTLQMVGTLLLPTLTANIINDGVMLMDMDYVVRTGGVMILVATATGIFSILATYFSTELATIFSARIRSKLFVKTQELSYQDFQEFQTSSLITRATNDIEQVQTTISMFFEQMLPAPFIIIIGMILAFSRDGYMALIIMISTFLLVIVFGILVKKIFPLFVSTQKSLDHINRTVGQYLSGIRIIRAFNRSKLDQEKMDQSFVDFANINIKINRLFAIMMPLVMLLMSLSTVAIVWFGGHRINSGNLEIGDIMAIIEYAMNILMYVLMAIFAAIYFPRAKVCANRILEILEFRPEIIDGKSQIDAAEELSLKFENVSFSYKQAEEPVLKNISFSCKKGMTTAIIGGTGSGKSTIARLLLRLLDTSHGKIALNGQSIKELTQKELRERIGIVPQKAFLFSGTIAENLRHGREKASLDEMKKAAYVAQAEKFIMQLPDKYDSLVSQGGKNFSGGQRQRLAIARMLIKKPNIYVFDDSFSALDFKTDANLRKALKKVTKNDIVINIAQRISTIKDADQIIVLDNGEMAGIGTHKELLKNCELYLEIAKSQLSTEELANELK
ncbi:ABC transporter ATP-binding protein [Enterococcus mundtii]|uniref:ABC transporter ATP-binding protein n=1 Tax=Enterococcus mundtii TaxID=53346 RepID=UPI001CF526C2|nr:ABC transporter ATP-binding protein [Enterococcus mundtii]MCA6775425.1 ABC transporter ATP-binding protein/permease [Enterococcus mundtii]